MNNNKKLVVRFILIIFLFIGSYLISEEINEQFPNIEIYSCDMVFYSEGKGKRYYFGETSSEYTQFNPLVKSELHNQCSKEYNYSSYYMRICSVDDTSIRDGDPILVSSRIESNVDRLVNTEILSGARKNALKKVNVGVQDLEIIYYSGKNISTYTLQCYNEDFFTKPNQNQAVTIRVDLKRPSFVKSDIIHLVIFITVFVLLGQLSEIIFKIFTIKLP